MSIQAADQIIPDQEGPLLALVVAAAQNRVIGRDEALAWRISDDLKWFKAITLGKPIIMGRVTYDSIGRPLPGRDNIVVSRRDHSVHEEVIMAASLEGALAEARERAHSQRLCEICLIGGESLYAQALERADRIYYTQVHAQVEGDAYFPPLDFSDWRTVKIGSAVQSDKNEHSCDFFILDRCRNES